MRVAQRGRPLERLGRVGLPVRRPPAGGGGDDVLHRGERAPPQRRVERLAQAHGDVQPLGHEIDLPVIEVELHEKRRVLGHELVQGRHQVGEPEGERGGDAQGARQSPAVLARVRLGLVEVGEDRPGPGEQPLAGGGRRHAPGRARQELGAEPGLELGDPPADGRGRPFELARRPRDAAPLGHRHEGAQVLEAVHDRSPDSQGEFDSAVFVLAAAMTSFPVMRRPRLTRHERTPP